MILCATYANLRSVEGTSYLPVFGERKRPGEMSGGYVHGECPTVDSWKSKFTYTEENVAAMGEMSQSQEDHPHTRYR